MSQMSVSTQELFMRLGATPRTRSARADRLFRKLRDSEDMDASSNQSLTEKNNTMTNANKLRPQSLVLKTRRMVSEDF